jgi:hypothetical protein
MQPPLPRARLETAAHVKMMRVVAPDGLGDNTKINISTRIA